MRAGLPAGPSTMTQGRRATAGPDAAAAARARPAAARETIRRAVPTMRDVARVAGVSQSTVSRVLNDAPTRVPIAPETRERVHQAARRVGYRPNPLARGLRGAPDDAHRRRRAGLQRPVLRDGRSRPSRSRRWPRGYNVVLGHAHGRADEGLALTAVLETRHCDAIIMLGDMQDQPRMLADLRGSTIPVVALWQGVSPLEFPTVDVDDRAGIMAGLEHLVGLGHERIAFISGRLPGDNWQRRDAYVEFMTERFGRVPPGYLQEVPNTLAGGEHALRQLLGLAEPPTAVATSTDLVAVGVLHAAYSLGRTVPDELSVVGFDDLLLAAHTVPALTTLRMPIAGIVGEGVKLAIELGRDATASREPRVTVFKPTLIVRQSTARPPGATRPATRRPVARHRLIGRPPAVGGQPSGPSPVSVSSPCARDPDPHPVDRSVRPREVRDGPDDDRRLADRRSVDRRRARSARRGVRPTRRGAVRRTAASVSPTSLRPGRAGRRTPAGPRDRARSSSSSTPSGRSADLEAVDERPALDREAAADGVDPADRARPPVTRRSRLRTTRVPGPPGPGLVDRAPVGRQAAGLAPPVAERRQARPGRHAQRQGPRPIGRLDARSRRTSPAHG